MTTLDEAAIQLADSLPVDAVPARLRCGSCNKLAVNALKLPCCAQSICEPSEDCTPIKSLRMSVKAFIKNEQKKRNKDTEVAPPPADTAAEAVSVADTPAAHGRANESDVKPLDDGVNGELETDGVAAAESTNAAPDAEAVQNGDNADQEAHADAEGEQEDEEDDDDHVVITTERPEQETQEQQQYAEDESYAQNNEHQEAEQDYGNGHGNANFGFGQNQPGFGGMDFGNMSNFNPMMMQNGMGMPNFAMGMQNMMGEFLLRNNTFPRNRLRRWQGMPGMNMDPSMMFNGGFGGMGGMNDMSMMNMGMGMGNMGGFGGMPGMGMGGGPGFLPGNGGYNQPSFGNNMHQNFHHNRGYGGRPYGRGFRGRGWGGYNRGRGNWQNQGHFQGPNPNYMNQQYQQQARNFQGDDENATMGQQQGIRRGSPSYEPMNGAEQTVDDSHQGSIQAKAEDGANTNKLDVEITDQTGDAAYEVGMADPEGKENTQPLDEKGSEGKHDFVERSPAQANGQARAEWEASTEASVQDVANDVSIDVGENGPRATTLSAEGGAEAGSVTEGGEEANAAMHGEGQSQFYDQQHQQGFGYGSRGRGSFRGGRGGFRGRGGAYGYVAFPGEPGQAVAPPINAPTGPKALREGKPNHGRYSRPAPTAPPAVSSVIETTREQPSTRGEGGRSRSRSRTSSDRADIKERHGKRDEYYESDEARHEKRRRRDDDYNATRNGDANTDKSSRKGRSRSETPDEKQSRHRHRDDDEDRYPSRSHRDRSRDKHRRRHRSRSPERDVSDKEGDVNGSRRKSKSDRRRDDGYDESKYSKDKERSRKSSRRDDDYDRDHKDRSNNSSRHARSGRDERDRDRDRERGKPRPVLEEPQDDIGFKIKGSKSASMQAGANTSMKPPASFARDRDSRRQSTQDSESGTPNTLPGDPYAEERERRQRERLDRENTLRRQSTQSLGKRTSRDEDEVDAPMGPKSDTGRGVKKPRRKVSYKYEDEVTDDYEERDRRWR